jgi:uncharacterized protein YbcV (DUF1398 family)
LVSKVSQRVKRIVKDIEKNCVKYFNVPDQDLFAAQLSQATQKSGYPLQAQKKLTHLRVKSMRAVRYSSAADRKAGSLRWWTDVSWVTCRVISAEMKTLVL